jgi:hypothetical protein
MTVGEKIWSLSVLLYLVWAFVGLQYGISSESISIFGSVGMISFVIIVNLLRILIKD